MKKIQVIMSMVVLLVMFVACGQNKEVFPFKNPIVRDLRPDCVFTVEMVNPIPNIDMNLVTLNDSCSGDKVNAIAPKTKQLVVGQKVEVVIMYYEQNLAVDKNVVIIK